MKIFYTVSFFLVSLISWSQPVDSHMPKDTSMLSAYVRQGAFLYSEASLVSDYIKQFKIDETVVALSFKKGGFDYIYVLDRDKKLGYVPLMDLTITDRTLDVLKRRNDTNQEERVSFAKKQVSTFLAKYIKAEQRVVRLSKFEEDNGISVTDWSLELLQRVNFVDETLNI